MTAVFLVPGVEGLGGGRYAPADGTVGHTAACWVFSSTSALTHISEVKGSDSHTQEQMWVVHSGSRIFFYLQMLWFTCISVRLFIYCINT